MSRQQQQQPGRMVRSSRSVNKPGAAAQFIESILGAYDPDKDFALKSIKNPVVAFFERLTRKPGRNATEQERKAIARDQAGMVERASILEVNRMGVLRVRHISNALEFQECYREATSKQAVERLHKIVESGVRFQDEKRLGKERIAELRKLGTEATFREAWADSNENTYDEYTPIMGGPWSHQMYLHDYLDMMAKTFEAFNHNPYAHRAILLKTFFTLGRGVTFKAKDPKVQERFKAWWEKQDMDGRLEAWDAMLSRDGELLIRKFKNPSSGEFFLRWISPSTIWEIVTDIEDIEQVFYYHQQYPCLRGDTRIPLLDGTTRTIQELAERKEQTPFWLYAYDSKSKRIVPGYATRAWKSGTKPCVTVTLDSGESITCTADHPFMLRDGSYLEAGKLSSGQSLMPLYRRIGYEQVWQPSTGWEFTHHMVAGKPEPGRAIHHDNRIKTDNRPENLKNEDKADHDRIHHAAPKIGCAESAYIRGPEWRSACSRGQKASWNAERKSRAAQAAKAQWQRPGMKDAMIAGIKATKNRTKLERDARSAVVNHKVISVELCGTFDVYDIEVHEHHNFAVSAGVFVHNCAYQVLYGAPAGAKFNPSQYESSRYIINQIPADEVYHIKINVGPDEKRGRSDLFNILGDLKRHKDHKTGVTLKAIVQSVFAWKNKLTGTQTDVNAYIAQFGTDIPDFGSVHVENEASCLEPMTADAKSGGVIQDAPQLVTSICVGMGLSPEYMGGTGGASHGGSSKATAVVGSEPSVKMFQCRQLLLGRLLKRIANDWATNEGIADHGIEFEFPEIAIEDRSAKIKDLQAALQDEVLPHQDYCVAVAKELGKHDYEYKSAQEAIDGDKATGRAVADIYGLGRLPAPVLPPGAPGAAPEGNVAAAPKPATAPAPSAPASLSGTERKAIKQAGTH